MKKTSIFENNPIKKAFNSVNIKSKLIEVKSEVKGLGSSISNTLTSSISLNDQVKPPP